jgi:hypothetical protein
MFLNGSKVVVVFAFGLLRVGAKVLTVCGPYLRLLSIPDLFLNESEDLCLTGTFDLNIETKGSLVLVTTSSKLSKLNHLLSSVGSSLSFSIQIVLRTHSILHQIYLQLWPQLLKS